MATIEEFKKIELIVAQIKEVADHPNADRLYVLKVDTGEDVRQLVAGIRASYAKEDLVGRRIIMVKNLEPAVTPVKPGSSNAEADRKKTENTGRQA